MLPRKRRLAAIYTLLSAAFHINLVYAHSGVPTDSVMTSWFRHVTSTSADGSWLWQWAWGADNTVSVVDRSPPVSFVSRPASFGRILEDAVNGYGIPMNAFTVLCNDTEIGNGLGGIGPNLGCPRLCPSGNHLPRDDEAWIAIVQRGNCSFVAKVREAQRFGAKAVIVGGDDPAISGNPDILVNMYSQSDSSDVKIPSTYIKFTDYSLLTYLIATSNTSTSGLKTVSLQITADYASWEWYSPILTFIVLLLLPSLLTLTTLLIHRIRAARAEQRERAPEDLVNRLPWRVWTGSGWEKHEGPVPPLLSKTGTGDVDADLERGDLDAEIEARFSSAHGQAQGEGQCKPSTSHDEEGDNGDNGGNDTTDSRSVNPPWFDAQTECAICLNDFLRGDRVRVLPCKHIFHLDEVDEWLIHRKKLCPICKADVTQPSHPYVHLHDELDRASERASAPAQSLHLTPPSSALSNEQPTERTPLLSNQRLGSVNTDPVHTIYAESDSIDDRPPTPYSYTSPSPSLPRPPRPSSPSSTSLTGPSRDSTPTPTPSRTRSQARFAVTPSSESDGFDGSRT